MPRGQLVTGILTGFDPAATRVGAVTGPVLVQLGEFDVLYPSSYAGGEAAFFGSASSVTVQSLPGVGHNMNTHFRNQRVKGRTEGSQEGHIFFQATQKKWRAFPRAWAAEQV